MFDAGGLEESLEVFFGGEDCLFYVFKRVEDVETEPEF